MAKEQFFYPGSKEIVADIDEAARRTGVSRGQAFEDYLTCVVCALSGQQMEEEYLATVRKGDQGDKGSEASIQSLERLPLLFIIWRRLAKTVNSTLTDH